MTDLYRVFDKDGRLLYLGMSFSALSRFGQHLEKSPWAPQATRIHIEKLPDERAARTAEMRAISTEKPQFNIAPRIRTPLIRSPMKALNDYMDRRGLTQIDMAAFLGVSQGHLNNWLSGKRKPSAKNLKMIAEKTRISLKRLLEDL